MNQKPVKALVVTDKREYSWWLDGIDAEFIESRLLVMSKLQVDPARFDWSLAPLDQHRPDVLLLDSTLSAPFLLRVMVQVRKKMSHLPVLLLPRIHDSADMSQSSTNGQLDEYVRCERESLMDTIAHAIRHAHGRQKLQHRLLQMALKDDLTQLHNRRGFMVLAQQHLSWARNIGQHMLLFFADLDGLKHINDQFGHREGDRALSLAAMSIKNTFRGSDVTARLSGDEFVALITQEPDRAANTICQRLRANLAIYASTECRYRLTMSIGVAHFDPEHPLSLQELMRVADADLYQQKSIIRQSTSTDHAVVTTDVTLPREGRQLLRANYKRRSQDKTSWVPLTTLEPTMPRVQA